MQTSKQKKKTVNVVIIRIVHKNSCSPYMLIVKIALYYPL